MEYTNEFEAWWSTLDGDEQASIDASVRLLELFGPALGRPHVDTVRGSKFSNLKELRTQHRGRPYRTLFAFNPKQTAILLIGGEKTGDNRWYHKYVPLADQLYEAHLRELEQEDDGKEVH